jgi:hypothetical protein
MYLVFLKKNRKLFSITTLEGDKGKLWDKIRTETVEKHRFPWIIRLSGMTGKRSGLCTWISIYIRERFDLHFEKGNW